MTTATTTVLRTIYIRPSTKKPRTAELHIPGVVIAELTKGQAANMVLDLNKILLSFSAAD